MLGFQAVLRKPYMVYISNWAFCKQGGTDNFHKEHVYNVYDKIAEKFSARKYKAWPRVSNFVQHFKKGSIILDIGCGNGRNMGANPAIQIIGIDRCLPLLSIARERGELRSLVNADAVKLPFRDESFDGAICIALLHHFQSVEMRSMIIREITRVIKSNSRILIYVRAKEIMNHRKQIIRQLKTQDFLVPWRQNVNFKSKKETEQQKKLTKQQQAEQYEKQKTEKNKKELRQQQHSLEGYTRFFHAFSKGQLECLIARVGDLQISKSYYDKSNWACIAQKK